MSKNATVKVLTGVFLALASSGAMAQSALQQLGEEAGIDAAPLHVQMKFVHDLAAVQTYGVPLTKDVFAGCSALEAEPLLAWNAAQAAILVQTCLNHVYPADGLYQVQSQAANSASVAGLKITVSGRIAAGDTVLDDLKASIKKRDGKLLGFKTALVNLATIQL